MDTTIFPNNILEKIDKEWTDSFCCYRNEIFEFLENYDLKEYYVCSKDHNEYGVDINMYDSNSTQILSCFLNINSSDYNGFINSDNNTYYLSSFSYNNYGVTEEIYSNRTEYYINGIYHGTKTDKYIDQFVDNVNKLIFSEKIVPELYDFILSDLNIVFINKNDFGNELSHKIYM